MHSYWIQTAKIKNSTILFKVKKFLNNKHAQAIYTKIVVSLLTIMKQIENNFYLHWMILLKKNAFQSIVHPKKLNLIHFHYL